MKPKTFPTVDALVDNLFSVMVARAPRRPSVQKELVPNYPRVVLPFGRMRQRWKRNEPVPKDTQMFASVLKEHGVYIFSVQPGFVECQAVQSKISKALGS